MRPGSPCSMRDTLILYMPLVLNCFVCCMLRWMLPQLLWPTPMETVEVEVVEETGLSQKSGPKWKG